MTIAADASPDLIAVPGQVTAIRDLSPDIVEVLVAPSAPLTILPGQYLDVSFEGFPARALCPTVCLQDPSCADALHFHIRRVPGGRVSNALGGEILGGHPVRLAGPFGNAHLQPGLASRLVLVAEDTGFAPIWSIAAVALDEQPDRRIDLIVGSVEDGFYMQAALRWLAAYANVTLTCVPASPERGLSASHRLADHLPALFPDDVVHVAGPASMVEAVVAHASAAGAVCYAEAFGLAEEMRPLDAVVTFSERRTPDSRSPEARLQEPRLQEPRLQEFPHESRPQETRAAEPRPSESRLSGWSLGPRTFARKATASRRPGARPAPEPGIRSRGGLDLYLAGSLVACSCLVLSTLVLVDPTNIFGTNAPATTATSSLAEAAPARTPALSPGVSAGTEMADAGAPEGTVPVETAPVPPLDEPGQKARTAGSEGAAPAEVAKDLVVAGVWAPDASACPSAQNRKRLIPAIITADGASAGDTFCAFKNKKPLDNGLDVVASCSNANRRWTAKVRLTVNGKRLLWSSERGTQEYFRCDPNLRMASAR